MIYLQILVTIFIVFALSKLFFSKTEKQNILVNIVVLVFFVVGNFGGFLGAGYHFLSSQCFGHRPRRGFSALFVGDSYFLSFVQNFCPSQ